MTAKKTSPCWYTFVPFDVWGFCTHKVDNWHQIRLQNPIHASSSLLPRPSQNQNTLLIYSHFPQVKIGSRSWLFSFSPSQKWSIEKMYRITYHLELYILSAKELESKIKFSSHSKQTKAKVSWRYFWAFKLCIEHCWKFEGSC